MPANEVNIVHIAANEHGPIFAELIELVSDGLEASGIRVTRTTNNVIGERLNLLIGATVFLSPEILARLRELPHGYIVYQMEALDSVKAEQDVLYPLVARYRR